MTDPIYNETSKNKNKVQQFFISCYNMKSDKKNVICRGILIHRPKGLSTSISVPIYESNFKR